jgi:hypothetical protein
MNAGTHLPTDTANLAAFARGLSIVVGGVVVTASALAWGLPGLRAAGVGTLISVLNVFLLTRFARQAISAAETGDASEAAGRLNGALGFKTIGLLAAVWCLSRLTHLETLPLALGLLVTAFCLVAAGLITAGRTE